MTGSGIESVQMDDGIESIQKDAGTESDITTRIFCQPLLPFGRRVDIIYLIGQARTER